MKNATRFEQAEAYFLNKLGKLAPSSQGKLRNLALKTNDLYIRKEIAIGGKIALIESDTLQKAGISSFSGNKLDDYINHIIDKLKFSYTNAATAYTGTPAGLVYSKALPAAIKNAQLNITQGGDVIFSLPISTINNSNTGNTILDDFRQLDNFEMLVSGDPIGLEIEFPTGAKIDVVAGEERHYVELVLGGFTTFQK